VQSDLISYLEKQRISLANRTKFPVDELAKYAGEWIAWSPDGAQIVAHAADPQALDDLIRSAGEDPEECLVEGIPVDDSVIGRVELDRGRA
jgi:hypothetical protein